MKFQCSFCYFINKIDNKYLGMQVRCGNCGKVMLIPKSAFGIGRVIADEFVIAKELGSGGLGVVYRAHQMSLDRDVALKLLYNKYAKDPEYAKDFKEEAKAAARISHPSIVKSLAFGRDHGILYFAMTLVEGETCSKLLKTEGNLKIDKALNIIQQVAEGLHEAWIEETLIHRDIKSSNIIVNTNGLAMVTDLGLARKAQKITKEKETSGTPAYMSPEQLLNDPLDSRSDIYSMGITLFELLTGELPFNGENLQEIARQHFSDDINFKNLDIAIPRNVQKLIKRMTAKELEDRFLNYEALLTDIVKVRKQLTLHKEAIPNVHTLSINRYKLFDRTPELKTLAQQKTEENIERQEKSAKQGILFIAGLILGMLLLGAVWFALTPSKNMQLIGELRSFLKKTESYEFNKVPLKLKKQGELLLKKYPIGESIYEVEVLNSLKKWLLDLKDAKNRKNLIEIDVKQREFIVIKEELEAKKNENLEKFSEIAELEEKVSLMIEKLKKDRRDFLKNEKITNKKRENTNKKELAKSLKREMNYSMLLGNAKMRIQKDLMKNNSAQKFRKSKTILNIYNSKKEYNKISDWLDLKLVELSYIEKFYTLFQERGKALVGETFENNRIVGFQGNAFTIHFMGEGKEGYSSSANLRSVGIDDLSHDFLIVLFKKMVTPAETSYNLYLAYYLLYNMDFASAMKVQPNNSQIKSTIGLYYRAQLENVKTLFAYRKYISKTQTRYLQQLYADTPWRKQLDKDLSQIMTSYQSKVPE